MKDPLYATRLNYAALEEINDLLHGLPEYQREGLVAVFTRDKKVTYRPLFVYTTQERCDTVKEIGRYVDNFEICHLDEFLFVPLEDYDAGLLVGIAALDSLPRERADRGVITKQYGFYSLEQLYLQNGWSKLLKPTLTEMATYLATAILPVYENNPVGKRRTQIKLIELSLPQFLADKSIEDLVAVIPPTDEAGLLALAKGEAAGEGVWLTLGDSLDPLCVQLARQELTSRDLAKEEKEHWIVGLHGLGACSPLLDMAQNDYLIELRYVLRLASKGEEQLHKTYRKLAILCARRASESIAKERDQWEWMTRSFMTQYCLTTEETTDLVTFVMPSNLDNFVNEVEPATLVYRYVDEHSSERNGSNGSNYLSLLDWAAKQRSDLRPTFSLLPSQGGESQSLGGPLWAIGADRELCETLILLASSTDEGPTVVIGAETRAELARQALWLIGSTNPWNWHVGRYEQWLKRCYEALDTALKDLAEKVDSNERHYYQALRYWYSCYRKSPHAEPFDMARSGKLDELIKEIARELRPFLDSVRATAAEESWLSEGHQRDRLGQQSGGMVAATATTEKFAQAQELLELVDNASHKVAPGLAPTTPMSAALRRTRWMAAIQRPATSLLSPTCQHAWRQWFDLRLQQRANLLERDGTALHHGVRALQEKAFHMLPQVFALPHELAVLRWMFIQEIDDLEHDLDEQQANLRIDCYMTGIEPWVQVNVQFTIVNVGGAPVEEGLELVLKDASTFELRGSASAGVRRLPRLEVGGDTKQNYSLIVKPPATASGNTKPAILFTFEYTLDGVTRTRQVAVPLGEAGFVMKQRSYNTGVPIEDPKQFFGREDEIGKIMGVLASASNTSFILSGPRRMGKTSVLNITGDLLGVNSSERAFQMELRRRFNAPVSWDAALDHYIPIKLSFQQVGWGRNSDPLIAFFRTLLRVIADAVDPQRRNRVLKDYERERRSGSTSRPVLKQLKMLLDNHPEVRLLVMLDEFDETYQSAGRDLAIALRDIISNEQRIHWIITSTLLVYKESQRYGSPWFNILELLELGRLDRVPAQRLIEETQPVTDQVIWESGAVEEVLDLTGCHPYFLQVFCAEIITHLNDTRQNGVSRETVLLLAKDLSQERGPNHVQFGFFWEGERDQVPSVAQLVLLAANQNPRSLTRKAIDKQVHTWLLQSFGQRINTLVPIVTKAAVNSKSDNRELIMVPWWQREIDRAFEWVVRVVGALYPDQETGTMEFSMPLFRRWLQRKLRHEDLQTAAMANVSKDLERQLGRLKQEIEELEHEIGTTEHRTAAAQAEYWTSPPDEPSKQQLDRANTREA